MRSQPVRIRVAREVRGSDCGEVCQCVIDTDGVSRYGPAGERRVDLQSSDERIIAHLGFARAVASRSLDPRCRGADREDLIAWGVFGLVQAAPKMQPLSRAGREDDLSGCASFRDAVRYSSSKAMRAPSVRPRVVRRWRSAMSSTSSGGWSPVGLSVWMTRPGIVPSMTTGAYGWSSMCPPSSAEVRRPVKRLWSNGSGNSTFSVPGTGWNVEK